MLRLAPVDGFRIRTVALGTAFPSGSLTVPMMVPPATWARADEERASPIRTAPRMLEKLHFGIIGFLLQTNLALSNRCPGLNFPRSSLGSLEYRRAQVTSSQIGVTLFQGTLTNGERVRAAIQSLTPVS